MPKSKAQLRAELRAQRAKSRAEGRARRQNNRAALFSQVIKGISDNAPAILGSVGSIGSISKMSRRNSSSARGMGGVKQTRLSTRSTPSRTPRFRMYTSPHPDGVNVRGTARLGAISVPSGGAIEGAELMRFELNPSSFGDRTSTLASMYAKFLFSRVTVYYVPTISPGNSAANGAIVMGNIYDPTDPLPAVSTTGVNALYSQQASCRCPVYQSGRCQVRAPDDSTVFYTSNNSDLSANLRFTSQGTFLVLAGGLLGEGDFGEILVDYDVQFMSATPSVGVSGASTSHWLTTENGTDRAPMGPTPDLHPSSGLQTTYGVIAGDGYFFLPNDGARYLIWWVQVCTGFTTVALTTNFTKTFLLPLPSMNQVINSAIPSMTYFTVLNTDPSARSNDDGLDPWVKPTFDAAATVTSNYASFMIVRLPANANTESIYDLANLNRYRHPQAPDPILPTDTCSRLASHLAKISLQSLSATTPHPMVTSQASLPATHSPPPPTSSDTDELALSLEKLRAKFDDDDGFIVVHGLRATPKEQMLATLTELEESIHYHLKLPVSLSNADRLQALRALRVHLLKDLQDSFNMDLVRS
jgi:hypothetical protein